MLGFHMEAEIWEQASVLSENADRYFEETKEFLAGRSFDYVILVARGSSDHAATYLRYLLEVMLGIPVKLAAPSVVTQYGARLKIRNCLTIGISQSGSGPDTAAFLESLTDDTNHTLAITNTPGSLLTQKAEATLDLGCGKEESVAATKSYTASLLACYQLARAMGSALPDPKPLLPNLEWIELCETRAHFGLPAILRSTLFLSLGRGFEFATALETALKLMECALLPCKGYSTADFEHGPKALAGPGSVAIVYSETKSNLEDLGCFTLKPPACVEDPLAPMRRVIFGQWLALLSARARGLNPDAPRSLLKITKTT